MTRKYRPTREERIARVVTPAVLLPREVRRGPLDEAEDMVAGDGFILPRAEAEALIRLRDNDDAEAERRAEQAMEDRFEGTSD